MKKKIYFVDSDFDNIKNSKRKDDCCVRNVGDDWVLPLPIALCEYFSITDSAEEADIFMQLHNWEYSIHNWSKTGHETFSGDFKMESLIKKYGRSKKYVFYIWDWYTWNDKYTGAGDKVPFGSYDRERLSKVLSYCDFVFVPNEGTRQCLINYKVRHAEVLIPFTRLFEPEENEVSDMDYIAVVQRRYPTDPTGDWIIDAANELGINCVASYKSLEYFKDPKNFRKLITNCTFVASSKFESSSGGMALIEAYNCGKPVLISDSRMLGANDFFGDRAFRYKYWSYEDLLKQIKYLWENRPNLDINDCKEFCKQFNPEAMAKRIYKRLNEDIHN